MTDETPHIVGVGNALVDVVAAVQPDVIERHGLTPGGMHLVDADAAHALFDEVGPGVRQSGGSVANSIAHLAGTGVQGTYLGKIADDDLGRTFSSEMADMGIAAPVAVALDGDFGTGRCVVLVTPDGERTMSTHLGAATTLMPFEARVALPERFDILFVEGYLWDAPHGAAVIETLAQAAQDVGARVALTPSDAGCVERNRDEMLTAVSRYVDILIGNQAEIAALAGLTGRADAELAMDWALDHVSIAAVTEHDEGSLVADATGRHRIKPAPVTQVVDSTGAGDAYASGFLGSITQGASVAEAGREGAERAATVLVHYGARDGVAARAIALPAA
ncbi:Sugar or nucleoside kinase, ribokinase family [Salinihabitans flavidus]|uniref:Sugar or nucleoside kinase, ribokinase family n=1 Tax=Salinihabitans flavidus TaxID=569882 RepID=A0A1H8VUL0_9RHOB|nr:adenosine kinase [Salinihabitans flavidus]SEP18907.1 Sugar or nucleoside kinase, ribokinase family [Salinihabitans flavidus]